jgi:hypothetical protein
MSKIKAIQTRYKGYSFRSRLEARWAVFFDALGLEWEYEPEGFDLGDAGWYLPDFRVTSGNITHWYEVKPFSGADDGKLGVLLEMIQSLSPTMGRVLSGDPFSFLMAVDSPINPGLNVCPRCGGILNPSAGRRVDDGWSCHACDEDTPCGGDNGDEIGFGGAVCFPHKGVIQIRDVDSFADHTGVCLQAAKKARSARFEHGECPV